LSSALSAPAVVWHSSSDSNGRALHSSEDLSVSDLMKNVLSEAPKADISVVFLVGKGADGSEQLSELASSGKLPETFAKYNDASGVYHSVSGIESTGAVVREAGRLYEDKNKNKVLEVSLNEFNSKLAAISAPVEVEIDSNGTPKAAVSSSKKPTSGHERWRRPMFIS